MSITSVGYDGTVNELKWAGLAKLVGDLGNVDGFGDLAVSIAGTGTLPVTVAAGTLFGRGVLDVNSAPVLLNAGALGSGTRYDTVVMARDWSSNTSVLALRAGGATPVATLTNTNPGVLDDQPLALIKIVAGQAAVQQVIPLVGTSGKITSFASIVTAAQMPSSTQYAFDRSTGHLWAWKLPQVGGAAAWMDLMAPEWRAIGLPSSVVPAGSTVPAFCRINGITYLRGVWAKTDGSTFVGGGGTGGLGYSLGTLPPGYRPGSAINLPMTPGYTTGTNQARLQIGTDGVMLGNVNGPATTIGASGLSFPAEL